MRTRIADRSKIRWYHCVLRPENGKLSLGEPLNENATTITMGAKRNTRIAPTKRAEPTRLRRHHNGRRVMGTPF